ncbi:MAG: metallophosphoesterase [Bacteroidales bacterium]|nr:metallophosphoesterase [Bacteroidales bacterium]
MKFQYCSDLHIEFPDNKKFLREKPLKPEAEVLLLAGDIVLFAELDKHKDFFAYLSDNFRHTYWVPGNHEYYQYDLALKSGSFSEKILPNVTLANNTVIHESGVEIVMSTLWSKIGDRNHGMVEYNMNDFRIIRYNGWKLSASVFNEVHSECLKFISAELVKLKDDKTIVLTHHIPTYLNYPERFKNDILNDAFAVELFDLINESGPDFWIYGHHHQNIPDFTIAKTQLINNQLGYMKYNENIEFNRAAIFEL